MSDVCRLIWCALVGLVQSPAALQAEILVLRHQLNVLRRKSPKPSGRRQHRSTAVCRALLFLPQSAGPAENPQAEDGPASASQGFRAYWRSKSRSGGSQPKTPVDVRQLIREMSVANPLWGRHGFMTNCSVLGAPEGLARRRRWSGLAP